MKWGKDIPENIAKGIKNGIGKVTGAVKTIASKIKSFLHFSEPDIGPLSDFHTYMPDMIDLMVEGISKNKDKLTKALNGLAGELANPIDINGVIGFDYDYATPQTTDYTETTFKDDRVEKILDNYLPLIVSKLGNMKVVLDDGTLIGRVEKDIITTQNRRRLAWK